MAMTVIIKLAEYVVPYFDVTVALAAYGTSWLAAAVLFASVVVDLRTWAARTGTMLPEVVFLTKTENSLWCNTNLLDPVRLLLLRIPRTSGSLLS